MPINFVKGDATYPIVLFIYATTLAHGERDSWFPWGKSTHLQSRCICRCHHGHLVRFNA